jgi:hypothetical protein
MTTLLEDNGTGPGAVDFRELALVALLAALEVKERRGDHGDAGPEFTEEDFRKLALSSLITALRAEGGQEWKEDEMILFCMRHLRQEIIAFVEAARKEEVKP